MKILFQNDDTVYQNFRFAVMQNMSKEMAYRTAI
jgi:hypothetical protein